MKRRDEERRRIPFHSVNRRGEPGHDSALQKHHLLPLQLLSKRCFGPMFDQIGAGNAGFEDFRKNGLLLPATEDAAASTGRPLHRGPHGVYNEMVIERVGRIESDWSEQKLSNTETALENALMRLELLQGALRRRLLDTKRTTFQLNRKASLRTQDDDFSDMDAMAEALWGETTDVQPD